MSKNLVFQAQKLDQLSFALQSKPMEALVGTMQERRALSICAGLTASWLNTSEYK
jgi:hypothetical protein